MEHPTLRSPCGYPDIAPHLRDEVRVLQRALVRWGYQLSPEGHFGPITDAAVRHFQRRKGLEDDGIVGPRTWRALLEREASNVGSGFNHRPPPGPDPTPKAPPAPLAQNGGPAWMNFAKAEVGEHEVKGKAANPRIIEYHAATSLKAKSDEIAWCASFVNWCLKKAGIAGTNSAGAASFVNWGVPTQAKYGAVCVIYNAGAANSRLSTSGNHVAFLVEETATHYSLLGGNQSDSVKVSNFNKTKWKLKGCRWPAGT